MGLSMLPKRRLAAVFAAAVGLVAATASEGQAFWDIPQLAQLAAIESAALGHLGDLLDSAKNTLAEVKEQTTILKTAYQGIDDLIHLKWENLREDVSAQVLRTFPQIPQIYGDLRDISDLHYTNNQARATLRGALYEHAYGPAIDYMHQLHENLDAVATAQEMEYRHDAKLVIHRTMLDALDKECLKGPGQCMGASQRAAVEQGQILADIHEATLQSVAMQRRMVVQADQETSDRYYQHVRFAGDFTRHVMAVLGPDLARSADGCAPGRCLYDVYRNSPYEVIERVRRRHPPRMDVHTMPRTDIFQDRPAPETVAPLRGRHG